MAQLEAASGHMVTAGSRTPMQGTGWGWGMRVWGWAAAAAASLCWYRETLWWHLSHSAEIVSVNSLGSAKHSAQEKLIIIILAQGLFLIICSISAPSWTVIKALAAKGYQQLGPWDPHSGNLANCPLTPAYAW